MATKKQKQSLSEEGVEELIVKPALEVPKESRGVQMRRVQKGSRQFMHDLYKLEVAKAKKNISYQKFSPNLLDVEHVHFYHSHNSNGKPLEYANFAGGHTHKITVSVDANGNPTATCGPAVKLVTKTSRAGRTRKVYEPIEFIDASQGGEDGQDVVISDSHTHKINYQHSEELSDAKLAAIHNKDKLQLGSMQPRQVTVQAKAE